MNKRTRWLVGLLVPIAMAFIGLAVDWGTEKERSRWLEKEFDKQAEMISRLEDAVMFRTGETEEPCLK